MPTASPLFPDGDAGAAGEVASTQTRLTQPWFVRLSPASQRWWPLGLGLLALVVSTSVRFSQGLWTQPEFEHGPLMLAVALWLLWGARKEISSAEAPESAAFPFALIFMGLALYLAGVRLKAGYFEFGAFVPIFAGALWLMGGAALLYRCAFVLIFLALATPLPAPWVFALTSGLKQWVSQAAEVILHIAHYPVARDGVTLRVGPYNLLMADACSGMNSLISLSAVGLLYIHLTARRSLAHLLLLVAAIIPIAIATNIVRVLILVLITYHLGDAAGQGFLHEFAGFVMFLGALAGLALLDLILGRFLPGPPPTILSEVATNGNS